MPEVEPRDDTLLIERFPALMAVLPLKVFAPARESVPLPIFVSASVPAVFLMTPEKVLVASLSPIV